MESDFGLALPSTLPKALMLSVRASTLLFAAAVLAAGAATPAGSRSGHPVVTSLSPTSVEAVTVDGLAEVTLTGTNLGQVTSVKVDGKFLTTFPAQFNIISDTSMTVKIPLANRVGPVTIEVANPDGIGRTIVEVVPNANPTVDMLNSDPSFLIQSVGLRANLGGGLGDILMVGVSVDLSPSIFPGIADFAIGNQGTSLLNAGAFSIPVSGYAKVHIPLSGLPAGLQLHMQAASLTASGGFTYPTTMSNVQTGTVLF